MDAPFGELPEFEVVNYGKILGTISLLPRVDQLWYQYVHMEKVLGNVAGARHVFERWMKWMPDQQGWKSYIDLELKYNEIERARAIFERFVDCHPKVSAWIKFAEFEMKNGDVPRARNCYERAVEKLGDDEDAEELLWLLHSLRRSAKKLRGQDAFISLRWIIFQKGRAEEIYNKFVIYKK